MSDSNDQNRQNDENESNEEEEVLYPRPTSEQECADICGYEFLAQNRISDSLRREQEQWLLEYYQHCVGQDLEPRKCGCQLINNKRCGNHDCFNRKNYVACPPECHPDCLNNPWAHDLFLIGKSTYLRKLVNRGFGIFAHSDIPRGSYIGEFTGIVQREFTKVPKKNSTYIMELEGLSHEIDPTCHGSGVSRINHHCVPNCETKLVIHGKTFKIVVIARKNIKKDEELTLDYKWKHDTRKAAPKCLCGHKKCKKIIGSVRRGNKKKQTLQDVPQEDELDEDLPDKDLADADAPEDIVRNVPTPFPLVDQNVNNQVQRLASGQIQIRRRPANYTEDHLFNGLDNVFVILPENGHLVTFGGVVVECYINGHGIPIYVVRINAPGRIEVHLPRYLLFHYQEDAIFRRDFFFSDTDVRYLLHYASAHANAEMGEGLNYDLVVDYAKAFHGGEIPETRVIRSQVPGALALGYPLYYLEAIDSENDASCIARKTTTRVPQRLVQECCEPEQVEEPSPDCIVVVSQSPNTYNADSRRNLNDVLDEVEPNVMLRRHFQSAVEHVTISAYSRLPPDFRISYTELYNLVRIELENHYYLADPSEQRFLRYTHFRAATEARARGSINLNWCSLCRKAHTFGNPKLLNRHYHLHHSIVAPLYTCPNCKRPFNFPSEFRTHLISCAPVIAADLRRDVMPFIIDALADYIQIRSGNHQLHIIQPGLPLMRQLTGDQDTHTAGENVQRPDIPMNTQAGTPVNPQVELVPFEWEVQKNYKQIDSWENLKPTKKVDKQAVPPMKVPQKKNPKKVVKPNNATQPLLALPPPQTLPAPSLPSTSSEAQKKRSRQKLQQERQDQKNEQLSKQAREPTADDIQNAPRVVKKPSKPRPQNQTNEPATSTGRTNPSRTAKLKSEQRTKEIQQFEKLPTSKIFKNMQPYVKAKEDCGKSRKPEQVPDQTLNLTETSSDDEDVTMFDPNLHEDSDTDDDAKTKKPRRNM